MPPPHNRIDGFFHQLSPDAILHQDECVLLAIKARTAYLNYHSSQAAGAVGQTQGDVLLAALETLETQSISCLVLRINSAGAHFEVPLAGLAALNQLVEALWRLRLQGVRLITVCDGWLYGGAAMLAGTVSHEVWLDETAQLGLFGHRVTNRDADTWTPARHTQPSHLSLKRISAKQWENALFSLAT